jgi:transcriptional regulator with XRE-family HTH domain
MTQVLAPKLKELRLRKGDSLQGLADAVGASKAHIWELETGKSRNPSMDLVKRLADYFKVSVASLMGEDPAAPGEDADLVAMFRDLKQVSEKDRELLKVMLEKMKQRTDKAE